MSRKGNTYNNALMESFYKTIKRELINDAQFRDIDQAQMEIFKYIETYYTQNVYTQPWAINVLKTLKKIPLILLTKCPVFLDNSNFSTP